MRVVDGPISPTLLREALAEHLRLLREERRLNQAEAAVRVRWSHSKLQRVETAVNGISPTDAKALVETYGVRDAAEVERIMDLADAARKREWFTPLKKFISPEYLELLAFEASATTIRSVNCFVMPGLLQTVEYARALLSVKHAGERLEGLLDGRSQRQREVLDRDTGVRLVFVIEEAMLRRQVGGRAVMAGQLAHLAEVAARPTVEIRVLPFTAGAHLGSWEQFMIMDLPDSEWIGRDVRVVYLEIGESEHVIRDDRDRIAQYEEAFAGIVSQSLDAAASLAMINRLRSELEGDGDVAGPGA